MDLLQYNHTDNESKQMLKMPYIHYIDVKSNEQCQQHWTDIIISQRDIPVPWPVLN